MLVFMRGGRILGKGVDLGRKRDDDSAPYANVRMAREATLTFPFSMAASVVRQSGGEGATNWG